MPQPALPISPVVERRLSGTPLALFLDIDGTLSPIAPRPEDAIVPERTKHVVRELTRLADCHVTNNTGRAAADARRMVDIPDVWLIGNHGLEVAPPGGVPAIRDDVAAYEPTIQAAIDRVLSGVKTVPGVLVEDKRLSLSVHFRLARDETEAQLSPMIADIGQELGLRLTRGKKVIELRPPFGINKGTAAVSVARSLGALTPDASILCAGDDLTDEDAFRDLRAVHPACVTVWVGGVDVPGTEPTIAEFAVPDPGSMYQLLEDVADLRRRPAARRLG
jgi:trehalose-phosphatase